MGLDHLDASGPGRMGLFWVKYADHYECATLFATQSVFLEDYGIAFVPDSGAPQDVTGPYRFWHIYESWFAYEWDG